MLAEFEEIEARHGAEKGADLRKACRYLLRHQFAYAGDRGVATVYNTLTDGRFRNAVDGLLDSVGYRVIRNAEEQWVGILLDDDDASSVPKLKLDETITLLVAAGHWQDDADHGDLLDRATSLTTLNVLYERYKDLLQSAAKPALSIARFLDLLRELEMRGIVDIGEYDRDQQDREVTIRSMIKLVSGDEPLRRIESYVKSEEVRQRSRADRTPDDPATGADA
mgnify:CR=1 FL=1